MPARSRWSSAGSATTCAPAPARSAPASTPPTRSPRRSPGPWPACRAPTPTSSACIEGRAAYGGTPSDADRRRRHPGPRRARPRRHAGALHLHGRAGRQRAARSLHRRRLAAGLSLARPHHRLARRRPARHARQDRRRGRRRSRPSSAPRAVSDFAIAGERRRLLRPRRVVLPPLHPALRAPRRRRRRRRRLRHRLGAARPHPGAQQRQHLSVRRRASSTLAADVKAVLGPGTKVTYAADWSEYFGHQPADGSGDVYFHLDPLWSSADIDAVGIDVYWPLADWRDGPDHLDRHAGVALDLRPRLPARQHRRRRGLRLVLRQPRRPRRAGAHAHHRRRRQALGVPLQGHPRLVAQPAFQSPRRRRIRHAHRLGAAVQALLVHRARLPRRRQGRQPAQRLRRPEELRVAPALLLARHAATTSCSAATCRPSTRPSIPAHPDYVAGANPTSAVYAAPHGRSRPHPRLLLGRAPLPRLPRQHRRVGRRRQLAARPLDHRPPRQRAARRHRRRHPRRLRLRRLRRQRAHRLARRLPHRSRAVRPRGPAAAGARLLHRRARERGPHRLRPPRLRASPSPS